MCNPAQVGKPNRVTKKTLPDSATKGNISVWQTGYGLKICSGWLLTFSLRNYQAQDFNTHATLTRTKDKQKAMVAILLTNLRLGKWSFSKNSLCSSTTEMHKSRMKRSECRDEYGFNNSLSLNEISREVNAKKQALLQSKSLPAKLLTAIQR